MPERTPAHVNRQIEQQIEARVAYFAEHREQIQRRIEELDQEWDIAERVVPLPEPGAGSALGRLER